MKVISIGEVLWDVFGSTEHLGGAPFNFAAHLRQFGHEVNFVSAVGHDTRGGRILDAMSRRGLDPRYVSSNPYPTGFVTVTVGDQGQPGFTIHRPAAYDYPSLTDSQIETLLSPAPDWIYYGTLLQTSMPARNLVARLVDGSPQSRCFYDVNLRPDCFDAGLIDNLLSRADVIKINDDEVLQVERLLNTDHAGLEDFCRSYAARFQLQAVCVTQGAKGCSVLVGDVYCEAPAHSVKVADTIGAGDAFAAAFLHALNAGRPPHEIADFANRVGAIVASKAGAVPAWTIEEALALP